MNRSVHRAAETELAQALRFYQREAGSKVASRFLDEFERVVRLLQERPGLGTPTADGRRVFPLSRFPYSLIYRPDADGIRILVLRHQHRDPAHGESRR